MFCSQSDPIEQIVTLLMISLICFQSSIIDIESTKNLIWLEVISNKLKLWIDVFLLIITAISTFHIILRNKTLTELRKVWLAQSCNYTWKKFQPKIVAKVTPRKVSRKTSAKKKLCLTSHFDLITYPSVVTWV